MDMTPQNRLVRKRNSNLQKQLDVNLQILGEEYRQTKERMYKDERECGVFLQSLYSTVPGLQSYGQPDTRAMNKNAMLKERRYSVSASGFSGDDSDGDDYYHNNGSHNNAGSQSNHPAHNKNPPSSVPFNRRPQSAAFPAGAGAPGRGGGGGGGGGGGQLAGTRPRSGKQEGGGGGVGGASRRAETPTGRSRRRPSTAGAVRSGAGAGGLGGRGTEGGPQNARRPSSGFGHAPHRDHGSHYGRNAYSEHDRSVHDTVIQKFQFIFNPGTKARSVNLSTMATPIVVLQPESGAAGEDARGASKFASPRGAGDRTSEGVQVNGEQLDEGKRPLHKSRRVVWSAHPRRKQGVVSAPSSARQERPRAGGAPASIRPASSTGRPATAANGSTTRSSLWNGKPTKPALRPDQGFSPVRLDPKVQALALQRSLPDDYVPATKSSHPDEVPESDKPAPRRKVRSHENTAAMDSDSAVGGQRTESPSGSFNAHRTDSPAPNVNFAAEQKENIVQISQKVGDAATTEPSKQRAASQQPKQKEPTKKQSVTSNSHPHSNPANQLQIPGNHESNSQSHHHHPNHHHHHHHHQETNNVKGWSLISSNIRRQRSDQDTVAPPTELLARLMRAGAKPGGESKVHKSAPSKSELSHRSMPAPRQTVAGILAQIENQKASTRYMLSASRDLQKVVKKLVPWEQAQDDYDYDDL